MENTSETTVVPATTAVQAGTENSQYLESTEVIIDKGVSNKIYERFDGTGQTSKGKREPNTSCVFLPTQSVQADEDAQQRFEARVEEVRRAFNRYSWGLALIVYPCVFIIGAALYWLTIDAVDGGNDLVKNGHVAFWYVCLSHAITISMLLLLVVFFVKYWNEPEVSSRDHGFIVHYCMCALLLETSVLITATVLLQMTNLKAVNADDRTLNETWESVRFASVVFLDFTSLAMMVPAAARMHYIYELTCHCSIEPTYWKVPLGYVVLYLVTAFASLLACRFLTEECSVAEKYSGTVVYIILCQVHYYFCAWRARSAQKIFADYWGNIRMFTTFAIFTWTIVGFGLAVQLPVHIAIMWFYEALIEVWIFGLENFAFVTVRVLSRHWRGVEALTNIDVTGNHYREEVFAARVINLLEREETAALLLDHSRKRLCQENIEFLLAVLKGRKCSATSEQRDIRMYIFDTYIVRTSMRRINLSHSVRENIEKRFLDENCVERTPMEIFDSAFMEIRLLVTTSMLASFLNSEEYQLWAQRMDRENKHVALLRQHQLLHTC